MPWPLARFWLGYDTRPEVKSLRVKSIWPLYGLKPELLSSSVVWWLLPCSDTSATAAMAPKATAANAAGSQHAWTDNHNPHRQNKHMHTSTRTKLPTDGKTETETETKTETETETET